MLIRFKAKYEVGKTILLADRLTQAQLDFMSENPFEYWCPEENSGIFPGFGSIRRNRVIAKEITRKGEEYGGEYHVTVEIDTNHLNYKRKW